MTTETNTGTSSRPGLRPYGERAAGLLAQAAEARKNADPLDRGTPEDLTRPLYEAGFVQANVRFFKRYAEFTGRSSPREYWLAMLGQWCAGLAAAAVYVLWPLLPLPETADSGTWTLGGILMLWLVLGAVMALPNAALTVRRLHDADRSGWLVLMGLIPSAGHIYLFRLVSLPPSPAGRRFDRPR